MKSIKNYLTAVAIPIAQTLVRNLPPSRARELVWRWGKWRSKDFVAETNGVFLAGNTLDLIQGYLYWFGVWEPNLTKFITRRMNDAPTRTFIDVGANIGYFSALVAKRHSGANVISVEAFPSTVDKLRANLERNSLSNVRVVAAAASDVDGVLELYYGGSENEGGTTSISGLYKCLAHSVPCMPLAEMLSDEELIAARLIKIDVEGAESLVIRGLERKLGLLSDDAEVIVEISSLDNSKFIFNTFSIHGFHAYELENNYDPLAYLYPSPISLPRRLRAVPQKSGDIIFSKLDAEYLA